MNHIDRHPYSRRRFAERKVLVLHPDPPMGERICTTLQIEGCQAAYATAPREFHQLIAKGVVPDAIVVGESPSGFDGLDALAQILSTHPMVPTFLIIPDANVDRAVAATKLGAEYVFVSPLDIESFLLRIREATERGGPEAIGIRRISPALTQRLTERERDVLAMIANGNSNKEAGQLLGISPRTVEVHRARIMEKLGARNAADLMRIVLGFTPIAVGSSVDSAA
jgi:two-component system, LuxR family, response regulator FixJ